MNLFHHKGTKAQSSIKPLFFFMSLCLCGSFSQAAETLTVAVASSLYPVMQQRAANFERAHHVTVRLVPGSTGRLYNQIMQGAPFDLFIAADQERPALLMRQHKATAQYAVSQGYLGVKVGKRIISELSMLTNPSIRHIAIANPDVAPLGKAAKVALQQRGLWRALQPKLIYAQNAMQAAMMVDQGLVDAGFVPLTSQQDAIAEIPYVAALLHEQMMAHLFLQSDKLTAMLLP